MPRNITRLTIRHWIPIVTFCPVNHLPDLIYISLEFEGFIELYEIRRKIRKLIGFRKLFMEDVASLVMDEFASAEQVTVRLAFNRHVVRIYKEKGGA